MIILSYPQGSIEWITARLWRLTGSQMKKFITSAGALSMSQAAMQNIDKLIAGIDLANFMGDEINAAQEEGRRSIFDDMDDWQLKKFMAHYNGDSFSGNLHTERGNDLEPDAIAAISERIGAQIEDVGMVIMGDKPNGVVACSPDGLVIESRRIIAGAEVKAPCLSTYYSWVADGELPDEHRLQVHAGMVICECDLWHFGAYFKGKPLFHVQVRRDKFTERLEKSLKDFREVYAERFDLVQKRIRAMGRSGK